jgi:hypothetical protein
MINAFGNYIGFTQPTQPVIIDGFIQNINIDDQTAYLIINYESGNANPLNGTGSFRFDTPKQIEYFIVGAGGKGGRAKTSWSGPLMFDFGAGGGGGGIASGSLLLEKDKEYTAIAGNNNVIGSKAGDSFLKGPSISVSPRAIGGGNGGNIFLNVAPGIGSGSDGGCGGASGYSQRLSINPGQLYESGEPGGPGENTQENVTADGLEFVFPIPGVVNNGIGRALYTGYGLFDGWVSGSEWAALVESDPAEYSYLSGSYVDIAFPAGGVGAGATNTTNQPGTASIATGSVGSTNYFDILPDAKGGNGLLSSITGTPTYYAGGGAGLAVAVNNETSANLQFAPGNWSSGSLGGLGGGGSSTGSISNAGNTGNHSGVDGLGGGAGPGALGGSGVVIIRYSRNQQDLIRS